MTTAAPPPNGKTSAAFRVLLVVALAQFILSTNNGLPSFIVLSGGTSSDKAGKEQTMTADFAVVMNETTKWMEAQMKKQHLHMASALSANGHSTNQTILSLRHEIAELRSQLEAEQQRHKDERPKEDINNATDALPSSQPMELEPDGPLFTVEPNVPTMPTERSLFGFMVQLHKTPRASLEVVRTIKKHMPQAPLYLLSSAGYHYSPMAKRFSEGANLYYTYDPLNVNFKNPNRTKAEANIIHYMDRLKAAALWCNCEYLVFMEDDTLMLRPLTEKPKHDAGGVASVDTYRSWSEELQQKFQTNWSFISHGMCGGSYVRVDAFLDAYARTNWTRIHEMGKLKGMKFIGTFNDVTVAVLMMDAGYELRPWKDLGQKFVRGSLSGSILHGEKKFYTIDLVETDGPVVLEPLDSIPSVKRRSNS